MKIVIHHDNKKKETFKDVTDYYLAVRRLEPMMDKKMKQAILPETRSFSYGNNVRELVKEVSQSLVELQEFLKNQNGSS